MANMKTTLERKILDFVGRSYKNDAEILEKSELYLATAEYGRLVALMEDIDKNYHRNAGVPHFELLGYAYQLLGESYVRSNEQRALAEYENALMTFEKGMHFATGSGEGWSFRKLFDAAHKRHRQIQRGTKR